MFTRIRWRLVAWSVLVLGLIVAMLGTAVYAAAERSLLDEVDRNLASRAATAAASLHELGEEPSQLRPQEGYRGGLFYLVVDADGQVLANSQQIDVTGLRIAASADAATYQQATIGGDTVRLYVEPLAGPRASGLFLVVGQSLAPEQAALRSLLLVLLAGGGAALVLSLLGGWFIAGRALVPIAQAFNRQQQFVADASHELRTPLTVLRSATDLLNQHRAEPLAANGELFDDVRDEIARLERLAGDLLTLARSDLGELGLAVGEVELAALAAQVVHRAQPLAQERGVALAFHGGGDPLSVEADPDRLQQVALILIDNALKHTPAAGRVEVTARRQGSEALLQVADTGEGIPAEHLPRVFDRFYRADHARRGAEGSTGLGLAIAKSLVEAHGGQMALVSSVGAGTTATVRLPLLSRRHSLGGRLGHLVARAAHRPET